VFPPAWFGGGGGGTHSLAGEGVGGPNSDEDTDRRHCGTFVLYLLHVDGPEFPMEQDGPDSVGEEGAHHVQVLTPHPPLVVKLPYRDNITSMLENIICYWRTLDWGQGCRNFYALC
jgi:hypothetical protein